MDGYEPFVCTSGPLEDVRKSGVNGRSPDLDPKRYASPCYSHWRRRVRDLNHCQRLSPRIWSIAGWRRRHWCCFSRLSKKKDSQTCPAAETLSWSSPPPLWSAWNSDPDLEAGLPGHAVKRVSSWLCGLWKDMHALMTAAEWHLALHLLGSLAKQSRPMEPARRGRSPKPWWNRSSWGGHKLHEKNQSSYIYIYIYIYVCMYICMYVYAHTYIHTYIHPSMHACICIYIYIHSCILFCTHHSPTFCEDIVVPHLYHAASRGTEQILEKWRSVKDHNRSMPLGQRVAIDHYHMWTGLKCFRKHRSQLVTIGVLSEYTPCCRPRRELPRGRPGRQQPRPGDHPDKRASDHRDKRRPWRDHQESTGVPTSEHQQTTRGPNRLPADHQETTNSMRRPQHFKNAVPQILAQSGPCGGIEKRPWLRQTSLNCPEGCVSLGACTSPLSPITTKKAFHRET